VNNNPNIGILVIVTGVSGVGQDSVMDGFWKNPRIQELNFKKIVTCTDRPPRPNETDGIQYHFVTYEKLLEMSRNKELVEKITPFGTCHKATAKKEIERLFAGENLIWRIDLSRATEVASGNFFKDLYPNEADTLQKHTFVFYVTAPKEVIRQRRKTRDRNKYDEKEYIKRDESIKPYLNILEQTAITINNLDGKLDETVELAVKKVIDLNDEINN